MMRSRTSSSSVTLSRRTSLNRPYNRGASARLRSVWSSAMKQKRWGPDGVATGALLLATLPGEQIRPLVSLYLLAITSRDYGVIMSMTLIYTIAIAGLNLVVDLFYGLIDPRIRQVQATA